MQYFQISLLLLGLAFLVSGYRKSNRNMLLAASLLLLGAYISSEHGDAFMDGFRAGFSAHDKV